MQIDDADVLVVHHAEPLAAPVLRLCVVSETLPVDVDGYSSAAIFERDAEELAKALWSSLPGGTFDRLTAALFQKLVLRSHLRITHASLNKSVDIDYQRGWDAALKTLASAVKKTLPAPMLTALLDALGEHHAP